MCEFHISSMNWLRGRIFGYILLHFMAFLLDHGMCHHQDKSKINTNPPECFSPDFTQVPGLSPALTATRSLGHQATGKHTSLLTSKTPSRRNTSFPEKPTKPKCPRVTYLYLISPCRSPSLSQTLVRACINEYVGLMLNMCP